MPLKSISSTLVYENEDVDLVSVFEKKGYRTIPILYINGFKVPYHKASQARPNQTLLSFLRDVMRLTGSKLGCAEGGCGACTVMISRLDGNTKEVIHYSVNACLMPVLSADGCHVTTVEGVGTVKDNNLHPIQQAMVDMHGSQCGFCTPGIIMALYALFANNPTKDYIEEHLDGNLCRCTGYRPIWDAARSLCVDSDDGVTRGPCGTPCQECPKRDVCEMECNVNDKEAIFREEKKTDSFSINDSLCCSSSSDKIVYYKEKFRNDFSWLAHPSKLVPKELQSAEAIGPLMVVDRTYHKAGTWFKPTTLDELLSLLTMFPGECKIVVGNTEIGIETKFKNSVYPRLIHPSHSILSLFAIEQTSTHLCIGACVPLSSIQHKCEILMDDVSARRIAKPIYEMLRWFASSQIRNVACLGGNLVTASPISDMNPLLACMGANLILASASFNDNGVVHRRSVPVTDFFLRYRTVDMQPFELVESIEVPLTKKVFEYVIPFKQARRREDDISVVTSGMHITLSPSEKDFYIIESASIAFGGMAPTTVLAVKTAASLIGKSFSNETFSAAREIIQEELTLSDDVPGGQAQYRRALVSSFLYKFYLSIAEELRCDVETIEANRERFDENAFPLPRAPVVDSEEKSGTDSFVGKKKASITGTQKYPPPRVVTGIEEQRYSHIHIPQAAEAATRHKPEVGRAAPHSSGPLHCTGEALYVDDIPLPPGTLHACLVLATRSNATLVSVDCSTALHTPGVVAVHMYDDLIKMNGNNQLGPIVHDEVVFLPIGERVTFVGQVIGICVAETLECAETGARSVKIEYEGCKGKTIVSIEDAIEANSFYEFARHSIEYGDVEAEFEKREGEDLVTVQGSFRCGGQEHFYLETNATLAVPSESATNLTIYASTQAASKTQIYCASATNTPAARVVVQVKRMGGGFGGKETRSVFASCAAAVSAKLCNRPVRLTLGRDVDMSITGGRHAFLAKYDASAVVDKKSGNVKLHSFDVQLYCNGGSAFDLSGPVMDRALFHVDGTYYWPNFRAMGVPCKTVQPPHTAFRGFGGPQGLAVCEHVIDHLAVECKTSSDVLRRNNMYTNGQCLPFGMIMGEEFAGKWNVPRMWDRLASELDVQGRRIAISEFNKKHKWIKRGLSCIPTKFGIAFTAKYMNQGGALVHLYTDGTVLISHGGTEMGQGLHTKVCQVAAQAFGIPLIDVYINDTSSDKVANTIPTAASMSTDMYGMATLDACRQILQRIEPVREKLGNEASLRDIAAAAHMQRIDMSAHGFFALDDARCGYDWAKLKPDGFSTDAPVNSWKGHPFNYFTQGVACTEVEIDVLTGNHRTIRSDVLIDVGSSINPAIDIGQVEGAFIQGMGWSTIEEVVYADDDHTWIRPIGKTFTTGPGTYKIPAFNDVPEIFNVSLMDDVDNPFAVHSSKAVGEPPFFLGTSVFYAIKDAVRFARLDRRKDEYFEFRMPATSERIRMYCADEIAVQSILFGKENEMMNHETADHFQPKGSF